MSFRPRQLAAVALVALALAAPAGVDAAPKSRPAKPAKVGVCHATDDLEKPYKLLFLPAKAAQNHLANAEGDHGPDFLAPTGAKTDAACVPPTV